MNDNTVELKDFISQTIIEICNGVSEAQEHTQKQGALVCPATLSVDKEGNFLAERPQKHSTPRQYRYINSIEFDVMITAKSGTEGKAGIGVLSGVFSFGASGKTESNNSVCNRIKFSIPIGLPEQEDKSKPIKTGPAVGIPSHIRQG